MVWHSFADAADYVADLIEGHGTDGRAHVVGLSMGGHVALALLERHAHLIDRAIISGVTAEPMPNLMFLKPQLWLASAMMHRPWFINMIERSMKVPADMQDAFRENLLAMSMRTYRRVFEEAARFRASASLRNVSNPTLVVAGGAESKIIINGAAVIAKLMTNAEARLAPGLRHGWNVEDPVLFSEMTRAWITGMPLPNDLVTL